MANGQNEYELVYIIQPNLDESGVTSLNERFIQTVEDQGGTMTGIELWGKRKLAYPIKKHFEGHYLLNRFQMPPEGMDKLELFLRFSEDVIRHMAFRTDG